jgi:formate hydrogenlyase subunit 3/multisubunit Na+/H+ antiporter MnhD subunit
LHIHKWYHYSFNPSWNLDIYMYISNLSRNNRWTIHFLFFYISTLWFTYIKKRKWFLLFFLHCHYTLTLILKSYSLQLLLVVFFLLLIFKFLLLAHRSNGDIDEYE